MGTVLNENGILPRVAALELTYECNHSCLFCSCPWEADDLYKQKELSLDEWKRAVDVLSNNGVSSFTLTGGEPLMRSDIKLIIDYIRSKDIPLNLITNGRNMNVGFLDFLADRGISICISIPGIETFKEHTGVDNVEHVLHLFEMAHARGINTTANIAVTKKNLVELYENIAYALLKGADYVLLNRFLPGGRGLKNSEYLLNKEETNQMLDIAEEVLEKANRYGHVGTELPLCAIDHPEKYKHLQVSNLCSAAKDFCVIDPSGFLKACNHSPVRICRYDELKKLKSSEYWNRFRTGDYLPEMCKNCAKTDKCDGGCREAAHVFAGSICAVDPIFLT